jgi:hypothetical protein
VGRSTDRQTDRQVATAAPLALTAWLGASSTTAFGTRSRAPRGSRAPFETRLIGCEGSTHSFTCSAVGAAFQETAAAQ